MCRSSLISVRVRHDVISYLGIYIARVDGNFKKEEIFYELLIRIYRSPEILFKMTGQSVYDL